MSQLITIPGKVFLIGEYSVLFGLPSFLAAIDPVFTLSPGNARPQHREQINISNLHPQSPSGILRDRIELLRNENWIFEDPHRGDGGFGGSTAQFALLYRLGFGDSLEHAFTLYRKMHEGQKFPPSGADLVTQWMGGVIAFRLNGNETYETQVLQGDPLNYLLENTLLFQATHQTDRKTETHSHLIDSRTILTDFTFEDHAQAKTILDQAASALQSGQLQTWGRSLTEYAEWLNQKGLEAPAAATDRTALLKVPGVLGVKGTGARLSDLIIIACEPGAREIVTREAEKLGLRWMKHRIGSARGIQCKS